MQSEDDVRLVLGTVQLSRVSHIDVDRERLRRLCVEFVNVNVDEYGGRSH